MAGTAYRRRVKRRRRAGENSKMKFAAIFAIMVTAVFLGYLTARFVIGPLLGYNADESRIRVAGSYEESTSGTQEQAGDAADTDGDAADAAGNDAADAGSKDAADAGSDGKDAAEGGESGSDAAESGYALQFGVFSTEDAAQSLVSSLAEKGIKTEIREADGAYKVVSPLIKTREEAAGQLNGIKDKEVEDVFIASF